MTISTNMTKQSQRVSNASDPTTTQPWPTGNHSQDLVVCVAIYLRNVEPSSGLIGVWANAGIKPSGLHEWVEVVLL